ncbi:MAG: extracellular solute-binding protein [Mycobacteriales bacterium]
MTAERGWRSGFDRRDLLRGAGLAGLAGIGAAAVSGCGSPVATGVAGTGPPKDSLTYWNLFSGGDGVRMVAMEDAYTKSHRDVSLNSVTLSWGNPYYTKLALATLSSRPPDIGISHISRLPTLARAGLLSPIDESALAAHGMTADKFTAKAWETGHIDGKLYCVPLDTHVHCLYYRTDVCKKAGLLDSSGNLKPIKGPDEFIAALAAAKKVTKKYGGVVNITADPSTCYRWFITLYSQLGGQVLADEGRTIVLDDDKAIKVLTFMQELTIKQKLMPNTVDGSAVQQMFSTGQVGFLIDGDWQVSTYQTAKVPFSMTLVPNIFGGPYSVFADSHVFVLPKDPQRNHKRLGLTMDFIHTLETNAITWAMGGHIPAWLPVQHSKAYRELKPESNYASAAQAAVYDAPAWYSGAGSDYETVVGSAVASAETGQMTPRQAVATMRKGLQKYATTKPPVS